LVSRVIIVHRAIALASFGLQEPFRTDSATLWPLANHTTTACEVRFGAETVTVTEIQSACRPNNKVMEILQV